MTGFGVATIEKPSENINLEIKSLNSRNLDIRFSGLNINAEFEQKIKKIISNVIERGSVKVSIELDKNNVEKTIKFDENKLNSIILLINEIESKFKKKLDINSLISLNDIYSSSNTQISDDKETTDAFIKALSQLDKARIDEGKEIHKDFQKRLKRIKIDIISIEKLAKKLALKRKSEIAENMKIIVYKIIPDYFDLLDFDNDDCFLDATLFALVTAEKLDNTDLLKQYMYGFIPIENRPQKVNVFSDKYGIIYIPNIGWIKQVEKNKSFVLEFINNKFKLNGADVDIEPLAINNKIGVELLKYRLELFDDRYYDSVHNIIDIDVEEPYKAKSAMLNNSLNIIADNVPWLAQLIKEGCPKAVIFNDGTELFLGGSGVSRGYNDGSSGDRKTWNSTLSGDYFNTHATQYPWLATQHGAGLSLNLAEYHNGMQYFNILGRVEVEHGIISDFSTDRLSWKSNAPCLIELANNFWLRLEDGRWLELRFDMISNQYGDALEMTGTCDGCVSVYQNDIELGEVCIDTSALMWEVGGAPWPW